MFHPSDRSDDICRLFSLTVCRKKNLSSLTRTRTGGRLHVQDLGLLSQNTEHASVDLVFEHPRTYCRTKQMFPRIQESALIFVEMFGRLQKGNVLESREDDLLQCLHEYLVFNCYVVKKRTFQNLKPLTIKLLYTVLLRDHLGLI